MNQAKISTIQLSRGHDLNPGDTLEVQTLDTRWWVRLWHALLLRPAPTVAEKFTIQEITGSTVLPSDVPKSAKDELLKILEHLRELRNGQSDFSLKLRYNTVIDSMDKLISELVCTRPSD